MKHLRLPLAAAMLVTLMPALAWANISGDDFVRKTSIGNRFEIESSKIALAKSHSNNVKDFAAMMVEDHTNADNELKSTMPAAMQENGANSPDAIMDDKHRKILERLRSVPADKFDRDYIKAQTSAHDETVKMFQAYAENGEDGDLKQFAADTLPTLREHHKKIKNLKP